LARALADSGEIIIAVRAQLVEDLTTRVAAQYLQQVTLDLTSLEAQAQVDAPQAHVIGRRKIGEWAIAIVIHKLVGQIRAGPPRLSFASKRARRRDAAGGAADIRPDRPALLWDSASMVSLVCKDFEVDMVVDGRVLRQRHLLRGQVELAADDDALTATPVLHERSFPLKLELAADSWSKVEAALASQDSLGRCGMFLDPENACEAARAGRRRDRGPAAALDLRAGTSAGAAGADREGQHRVVQLSLAGERFHSSKNMLWSSTRGQRRIRPASGDTLGPRRHAHRSDRLPRGARCCGSASRVGRAKPTEVDTSGVVCRDRRLSIDGPEG
jgi:hypothetical protein